MPHLLTSWKEIGQYLSKGVRTVQRWERELGLPVRRPAGPTRRAVLAVPEELDAWTRSRAHGPGGPVIEALRSELAAMRAETAQLRSRMEMIESTAMQAQARKRAMAIEKRRDSPMEVRKDSSERHRRRVEALATIRAVRDDLERMKELWLEAQTIRAESMRQSLSAAWTMWWTGEQDRLRGKMEASRRMLQRAQAAADKVRKDLDQFGCVPKTEMKGLQREIKTLEERIQESFGPGREAAAQQRA